ncbi:MAG: hypothetical protein NTW07_09770, partial [candidate division Zixibacteria bacterium]|nr:hypothetical protein [candidate division Zixibacteria bacterium]
MSIQFGLRRCNIVLLAILLLTFLSSCENRDSPVDNNSGYSREIEPKIYLEAEGSGFQDIWASSEDNIYTV